MHKHRNTKITKSNTGEGYLLLDLWSILKKNVKEVHVQQSQDSGDCFLMIGKTAVKTLIYASKISITF